VIYRQYTKECYKKINAIMEENNQRDVSVDILKFFAVFIIMNSHMDGLYTHYKFLATGGAIGDVLFLFLSGYTLFLGRRQNFSDYYKRRISRITTLTKEKSASLPLMYFKETLMRKNPTENGQQTLHRSVSRMLSYTCLQY
jgi:hypothetical protein